MPVPSNVPVEWEIDSADTLEEKIGFLWVVVAGRLIDINPSDLMPPEPTASPPPTFSWLNTLADSRTCKDPASNE